MSEVSNREAWEQRSQRWGASLRSVLFKGLPDRLNEHIHQWHTRLIADELSTVPQATVLDVGCGYGRLTNEMLRRFPGLEITGVDLTDTYVRLYREQTGRPAQAASVEQLPQDLGRFDRILCVTVLMYVDPGHLDAALRNLIDRLAINGKLILIEPHTSCVAWQTAFGLLTLLRKTKAAETDTGGRHFTTKELNELIEKCGGQIERERRIPITTVAMLPLFAWCTFMPDSLSRPLLRAVAHADQLLERLPLPTLYRALTITARPHTS